jgi:hypothetical protein
MLPIMLRGSEAVVVIGKKVHGAWFHSSQREAKTQPAVSGAEIQDSRAARQAGLYDAFNQAVKCARPYLPLLAIPA